MSDPQLTRQSPFAPPGSIYAQQADANFVLQKKHSGLGIASLVLAIVLGITAFSLVVIAGVMAGANAEGMDEESAAAIILGLSIFAVIGLNFVGFALGVAGLFQRDRLKVFAILGTLFNGMVIAGMIGLIIIGLTMTP